MNKFNDINDAQKSSTQQKNQRSLPCRGCLKSCKSFDTCQGYPWRMPPAVVTGGIK